MDITCVAMKLFICRPVDFYSDFKYLFYRETSMRLIKSVM